MVYWIPSFLDIISPFYFKRKLSLKYKITRTWNIPASSQLIHIKLHTSKDKMFVSPDVFPQAGNGHKTNDPGCEVGVRGWYARLNNKNNLVSQQ